MRFEDLIFETKYQNVVRFVGVNLDAISERRRNFRNIPLWMFGSGVIQSQTGYIKLNGGLLGFIKFAQFECQNKLNDVLNLTGAFLLLYANMLKEMF
jgi:hypothetical protein